ncbi:MAG TPA: hypothetical protein VML55_24240, partial [Planctomycetaceae bacterium]|nr:hypothetical protein [Planctomycetaceae bacterium]
MQAAAHQGRGGVVSKGLCVRVALVVLTGLPAWTAAAARADDRQPAAGRDGSTDTWQVIYIGEQRIGYAHTTVRTIQRDGRPLVRTRNETKMQIKRFGQSLKVETLLETEETPDGGLLGFTMEMKNPPAGTSRTVGRLDGDQLVLEKTDAGRTSKKSLPWDRDVKSPAWQERALKADPLQPGQSRSFKTFMPEFNAVASVRIAADDQRLTKLHDGQSRQLLKVQITQSVLPGMTIRGYVDDGGETLKTEMDFLGQTMTTYSVPADVALQEIAEGGELDLAVNTLVRVERIRDTHETKRITYRITIPDEDPAAHVTRGDTQSVRRLDGSTAEVTVTAVPIPDMARPGRAEAEYLAATEYLQCTDRRVIDHARRAAAGETDAARIARRMEKYVHEKVSKKDFSIALASAA